MRLHPVRSLILAFLLLVACPGCAQGPVMPPSPEPQPAAMVTQVAFDSIPLGATEAEVRARFGPPSLQNTLPEEGVKVLVYPAATVEDNSYSAEFWFRDGALVNKVLY